MGFCCCCSLTPTTDSYVRLPDCCLARYRHRQPLTHHFPCISIFASGRVAHSMYILCVKTTTIMRMSTATTMMMMMIMMAMAPCACSKHIAHVKKKRKFIKKYTSDRDTHDSLWLEWYSYYIHKAYAVRWRHIYVPCPHSCTAHIQNGT